MTGMGWRLMLGLHFVGKQQLKETRLVSFLPKEEENPCCLRACGSTCWDEIPSSHLPGDPEIRVVGRRDSSRLELL